MSITHLSTLTNSSQESHAHNKASKVNSVCVQFLHLSDDLIAQGDQSHNSDTVDRALVSGAWIMWMIVQIKLIIIIHINS